MKLSELLTFYKAQHSLFGECPSCGEVFRFSDSRIWYGTPPDDWLVAFKRMRKELEEKHCAGLRRGVVKRRRFVRLT